MRALLVALALLSSTVARADDQQLARAHFLAGRAYYDQQRWDDALTEFQASYKLSHRVELLYNIGVCQENLGHYEEAETAFRGYLGAVSDANERASVEERIAQVHAKVQPQAAPAPAVTAPPATVALVASPPPARKPVWKRGVFWGVLGGVAAVVVAGVVVGVVLGTQSSGPRTLPDVSLR